jgi:hypothetical protein
VSGFWTCSSDEDTIRDKIAQHEFNLKELFERLDRQESLMREIDGLDMTAWPEKYNAWRWYRHTLVHIQEIKQEISRLYNQLPVQDQDANHAGQHTGGVSSAITKQPLPVLRPECPKDDKSPPRRPLAIRNRCAFVSEDS